MNKLVWNKAKEDMEGDFLVLIKNAIIRTPFAAESDYYIPVSAMINLPKSK